MDYYKPTRFEEIPKRADKMMRGQQKGFWHNVRNTTNRLGDSSYATPLLSIATPIVLRLLSVIIFMLFYLVGGSGGIEWFLNFIAFSIIIFLIQELILLFTYGYVVFISYHQIRYNINRWTGVIAIALIILTIPMFMVIVHLMTTSNLLLI